MLSGAAGCLVGYDAGGCEGELDIGCHGIRCSPVLGGYPVLVPRTRKRKRSTQERKD
jgi:hypothetical protein